MQPFVWNTVCVSCKSPVVCGIVPRLYCSASEVCHPSEVCHLHFMTILRGIIKPGIGIGIFSGIAPLTAPPSLLAIGSMRAGFQSYTPLHTP